MSAGAPNMHVQALLLVRTVTSYHVRVLKFSPFEPDHFVSAGRDSIRCYRMKGEEIRGISIKMQVCVIGCRCDIVVHLRLTLIVSVCERVRQGVCEVRSVVHTQVQLSKP